ncbi:MULTISPECIES: hypothetical protein [unclassified Burkholderia]|uniref:hypothetical protein n=1 Tax=unclassified Burkholderia TaxID=2613784 RepID=UPI00215002DA|nr:MULTISPECIES: hypothetical protein [unclassified Burkholderia]MCR4471884.1 hypothetical protein [Burkholderia sp. SCN-KJ]
MRDPSVVVVGEDVGRGGIFQQYKGLQAEFGPERIIDAPIPFSLLKAFLQVSLTYVRFGHGIVRQYLPTAREREIC